MNFLNKSWLVGTFFKKKFPSKRSLIQNSKLLWRVYLMTTSQFSPTKRLKVGKTFFFFSLLHNLGSLDWYKLKNSVDSLTPWEEQFFDQRKCLFLTGLMSTDMGLSRIFCQIKTCFELMYVSFLYKLKLVKWKQFHFRGLWIFQWGVDV